MVEGADKVEVEAFLQLVELQELEHILLPGTDGEIKLEGNEESQGVMSEHDLPAVLLLQITDNLNDKFGAIRK